MIAAKPTPSEFLDASVYMCVLLEYYWDNISKKRLRMTELSVECLQWFMSWVLIWGDHSQGGDESCSLLKVCIWRPRFPLIILKCSKIEFLLLGELEVRGLWSILLDIWSGMLLILVMYLSIWLWRLSSRGSSPALLKMLSTGLVLKAPVARRIPRLWIGLMVLSTVFFAEL